jgi:4-hydroxy-3-polyprenylbenzoate decarboxylase
MKRIVCGITGASGTIYGRRLVQVLLNEGHEVHLIVSEAAKTVLALEEGIHFTEGMNPETLVGDLGEAPPQRLIFHRPSSIDASVASGSFPVDGVAVVPCSMATVGAVCSGAGRNLIHRVADVALKESTRLVIGARETPLSTLHLENMARLSRLGARIVACMPGFYGKPERIADLVDFVVQRVCDQLDCSVSLVKEWSGG